MNLRDLFRSSYTTPRVNVNGPLPGLENPLSGSYHKESVHSCVPTSEIGRLQRSKQCIVFTCNFTGSNFEPVNLLPSFTLPLVVTYCCQLLQQSFTFTAANE